jgi:D-inositol-3-phosphate glycosyltransferase
MMNICAISFHCCPFSLLGGDGTGGMNVYLRELCSVTENFPETRIDVFTRIQNPRIRGIKNFSSHARVIHLKGGPERPVDRTKLYDFLPEFTRNLESFIVQNKEQYDLIYSHYWLSGLVGERMKKKLRLPLVHIYHTLAFMKKRALDSTNREDPLRLESEQSLADATDAIISSSEHEKQCLCEEYSLQRSKIKVIYPGVSKRLFFPVDGVRVPQDLRRRKEERILLYVGRIDSVKGLMNVVEALSVLKSKNALLYDRLKFVIIGGGRKDTDLPKNKDYIRLNEAIRKHDFTEKFFFLGSKKQSQLRRFYSASDALVVPSLYESFGLVAMEALACGTPVIASNVGELGSLVQEGKNGFTFHPNNPASLASCLELFFSHEKNIWEKKRIRRDLLANFSWEKTASDTYSFLRKIAEEKVPLTTRSRPGEILRPV